MDKYEPIRRMSKEDRKAIEFEIWSEGYQCTGESGKAYYHGSSEGETFEEACCKLFYGTKEEFYFRKKNMTYWGSKLFDNEDDARKNFG